MPSFLGRCLIPCLTDLGPAMADPRFFDRKGPFSCAELAEIAGATLSEGADPSAMIEDVAPLAEAGPNHLSFLDNRKYVSAFQETKAGLVLVKPEFAAKAPVGVALLMMADPYRGFAHCARRFYPDAMPAAGVHPRAVVHETAEVADTAHVAAGAVLEAGVKVGANSWIEANAVLAENVEIGEGCRIGAGAALTHTLIGNRVRIYPGARIGQDGFGFAMGAEGHLRIPQVGRVVIEDDVEIGANTTIDRGAGPDTVIGQGAMIDNLVQLGHNVTVGRGAVIVSQAGVSGSTSIGDFAVLAAQAGAAGHLRIGNGARLGAKSGAMRDIPDGETHIGTPAMAMRTYWRAHSAFVAAADKTSKKSD